MLFPLVSTLKLALLLQNQRSVDSSVAPLPSTETGDSSTGVENELLIGDKGSKDAPDLLSACTESAVGLGIHLSCCPTPIEPDSHNNDALIRRHSLLCQIRIGFHLLFPCAIPPQQNINFADSGGRECFLDELANALLPMKGAINGQLTAADDHNGFSVIVDKWDGEPSLTADLLNALRPLTVLSLDLDVLPSSAGPVQMPNLGFFLPRLRHLTIQSSDVKKGVSLSGRTFLRDLPALKAFKAVNVHFSFEPKDEPQWIGSLERIHVENGSLRELPWWFSRCSRLERLTFLNCGLSSVLQLSQLPSAVQIRANGNAIVDLHKVVFKCTRLHQLDLRGNHIPRIAPHTFSRCHSLRLLDLSNNLLGKHMPDKVFAGCHRLKQIRLEQIALSHLRPELFIGLANLKWLSLAGNPLSRIDPFSFLPTRSIRTLSLANCSLDSIPLAVTQCCLLESLSMDDNLLASRQSMPPEVLALLSRLSQLSFHRNPLLQLPRGLFLYEPIDEVQEKKLADIVNTLIQLPVWRLEPCTPFLWHFHLRNATSPQLRNRVGRWNEKRMHKEKMSHCKQLYETIQEGIAIYRDLLENSGCEASRRLRSVRAKESCSARQNNGKSATINDGQGKQSAEARGRAHKTIQPATVVQLLLMLLSLPLPSAADGGAAPKEANSSWRLSLPSQWHPNSTNSLSNSSTERTSFGRIQQPILFRLSAGINFFLLVLLAMTAAAWMAFRKKGKNGQLKRSQFEEIF